jgi:hypothetical protein
MELDAIDEKIEDQQNEWGKRIIWDNSDLGWFLHKEAADYQHTFQGVMDQMLRDFPLYTRLSDNCFTERELNKIMRDEAEKSSYFIALLRRDERDNQKYTNKITVMGRNERGRSSGASDDVHVKSRSHSRSSSSKRSTGSRDSRS